MKNFALLIAFVLLALAAPAWAAETSTCAPVATTLEHQTEGPVAPFEVIRPFLYCSDVNGTSCPTLGATKPCTDVCHSQLSCTCTAFGGAKYWYCDQEC